MLNDIIFNNYTNDLQHKMLSDIDKIKKSDNLIIKSNETGNYYIDAESYHKIITTEVYKFDKKADRNWDTLLTMMSKL